MKKVMLIGVVISILFLTGCLEITKDNFVPVDGWVVDFVDYDYHLGAGWDRYTLHLGNVSNGNRIYLHFRYNDNTNKLIWEDENRTSLYLKEWNS